MNAIFILDNGIQDLDGKFEVFSEDSDGTIKYEGSMRKSEIAEFSGIALRKPFLKGSIDGPSGVRPKPLFSFDIPKRQRILRIASRKASPLTREIAGFLSKYPLFSRAMATGDFSEVARLILETPEFVAFRPLLSNIAGENRFFPFAWKWINSNLGSKREILKQLLDRGGNSTQGVLEASQFAVLFEFARNSIQAKTLKAFERELSQKSHAFLKSGNGQFIAPVAGTRHHSALSDMLEMQPAADREKIRGIQVSLVPEPENASDKNAIAVMMQSGEGHAAKAGYLKREFAASMAPLMESGNAFAADIYRLWSDGAELRVKAV